MRWKIACLILLILAIWLGISQVYSRIRENELQERVDKYAKEKLREQGYQEGEYEKPKIPDAPPGSKALLHVSGKVHYASLPAAGVGVPPLQPSAEAPASLASVAGPVVPRGNPCDLNALDVTIGCTVDAMSEPGKPFARLLASGEIRGWDQIRILPEQPSGEIHLQVAPSAKPKTWGLDFLAGAAIGSRNGLEAGFSGSGKGRLGWYSLVEYQYATTSKSYDSYSESYYSSGDPSTVRFHAGVKIRIK
jgi:hypothetical protein